MSMLACGNDGGAYGPRERIARFARCRVPVGAVSAEDALEPHERGYRWNARVVVRERQLDTFLESCGVRDAELTPGYEASESPLAPNPVPPFWVLPSKRFVLGVERRPDELFLLVERDTDYAIFLGAFVEAR
ncbi:MAG: hypothetical protein AAF645_23320 [Myxococcota bacterium]